MVDRENSEGFQVVDLVRYMVELILTQIKNFKLWKTKYLQIGQPPNNAYLFILRLDLRTA